MEGKIIICSKYHVCVFVVFIINYKVMDGAWIENGW